MTSSKPPSPGSPERKELAHDIFEKVSSGQMTYREVTTLYNLSGTSVACRLYNEAVKTKMTVEIRDAELARLDSWHEKLEEAAEKVLQGDRPDLMAALATSAARVSKERRAILAVDLPATLKLQNMNPIPEPPPIPNLQFHMDKLKDSAMYRDDLEATGG